MKEETRQPVINQEMLIRVVCVVGHLGLLEKMGQH